MSPYLSGDPDTTTFAYLSRVPITQLNFSLSSFIVLNYKVNLERQYTQKLLQIE